MKYSEKFNCADKNSEMEIVSHENEFAAPLAFQPSADLVQFFWPVYVAS